MTLHISTQPPTKPSRERMEHAVTQRKHVKKAFLKFTKAALVNSPAHVPEKFISSKQADHEWDKCAPLQRDYLDAGLQVVEIAAAGIPILDNREKCLKVKKDPALQDICQELDQLFFHVVSKPTRRLRQCMDKPATTTRKRQWAHEMLTKVLTYPILTFFKAADILGSTLIRHIDELATHSRLSAGLLHVLMYISDCYRYLLQHNRAKDAAELMRILAPGDAEAHMRVAINLAMLSRDVQELSPFFHYCAFLANRKVSIDHSEAVVVSRYVHNVRVCMGCEKGNRYVTRQNFTAFFIDTLWSILAEDFNTASEKAKREELWSSFEQYLKEGVPSEDLLLIIGCLIFAHYRISPKGNKEGITLPQSALTEAIICRVISCLSLKVCSRLQELNQMIRGRKRNRRRAIQKKRRLDGHAVPGIAPEMLGYEALKSITDVDSRVPYLGALSFLAHYWSKARMAPNPDSDFDGMACTLDNLHRVMRELLNIEKTTCTTALTGLIGSKIIADATAVLPAMAEDIMFSNYYPCKQHNMFRSVLIQDVPLPSVFRGDERGLIKRALRCLGDSGYESLVQNPVRRHLEAFGQMCLKESDISFSMDKESSAAVVMLTLRKFRINRLILGLEKVGGGKLSRMIAAGQNERVKDKHSQDEYEAEDHPPAGQPLEDKQPEQDSFEHDLTSRELGSRLRKRRRLMGNSTPADVGYGGVLESNSNESARVPEESDLLNRSPVDHEREQRPTKRMKTTPSTKKLRGSSTQGQASTRRAAAEIGLLSQGSLQLIFTPPINSCGEQNLEVRERVTEPDRAAELSRILREVLYPTNQRIPSPPRNLRGPAYWRSSPSDDFVQVLPITNISRLQ